MKVRIIPPILLAGTIIAFGPGCKPGERDAKKKKAGSNVELVSEFIITGYSGPPPDEVNEERYQEIADAGIQVIVPGNGALGPEENLKAMDLAQKVGMRVLPVDMRVIPFGQTADVPLDTAVVGNMVRDYKDHPAFAGYVVRDEPGAELFPALSQVCAAFREKDPAHEPFINLFPSYAGEERLGGVDFRTYLRSFIDTVKPGILSYDFYALRESGTMDEGWFSDLAIVREEARTAGIPFWVFIQSEGIRDHFRIPNRTEILWQVNTAVAYGAMGLGWFTYWTPESDQSIPEVEGAPPPLIEEHYGAMIDINGDKTPLYDYVTEANHYISEVGRGLAGWDNTDVARYEMGMLVEGSSPIVKPFADDANLVIGTFSLGDRRAVMIANSSIEMETMFSMVITEDWHLERVVHFIDAIPGEPENPEEGWMIDPGGSIILEFSKN